MGSSVVVYVCTHRRNEALRSCLLGLERAARAASADDGTAVGAVVVDDNPDGRARGVAEAFEGHFPLGMHYVHAGSQNISAARNAGLDTAAPLADWVGMTDDDCVPDERWLVELLAVQRSHDADAVTGPMVRVAPPGSAAWLTDQPFLDVIEPFPSESGPAEVAYTNNSMVRSSFLLAHPEIRFDLGLGTLGGEDMVFYRRARAAGLRIALAPAAAVTQVEDAERCTFRYRLYWHLWMGNTEAVTNRRTDRAGPGRLVLRGTRRAAAGVARPFARLARRERPQWRYSLALVVGGVGLVTGAAGIELRHR